MTSVLFCSWGGMQDAHLSVCHACKYNSILDVFLLFFTSRSARSARTAGTIRLLYVFRVCLFVCLSVCASALITCAIYYAIRYYATAVYSSVGGLQAKLQQMKVVLCCYATAVYSSVGGLQAKLQQMKVVLCCLDGKNVVGSHKDPGFLAYSYY